MTSYHSHHYHHDSDGDDRFWVAFSSMEGPISYHNANIVIIIMMMIIVILIIIIIFITMAFICGCLKVVGVPVSYSSAKAS